MKKGGAAAGTIAGNPIAGAAVGGFAGNAVRSALTIGPNLEAAKKTCAARLFKRIWGLFYRRFRASLGRIWGNQFPQTPNQRLPASRH
ncbi:MAG: hypothetical protein LBD13_00500 [Spirochaetaceae bacterium]|jgi:uncharacterized protein YcfJ|nr:hypothetical protein [Spirochaetaceae bacterium]